MNIVLMMVSSVNGKITRNKETDVRQWTSPEDGELFVALKEKYPLIVMGRHTYEIARPMMKLNPAHKRIVLTAHPELYQNQAVEGQLEFTDKEPRQLVEDLEKQGHKDMLLVGGGLVNAAFFEQKLVTELHLSIEPKLFGQGNNLLSENPNIDISLQLKSMNKLNDTGTIHCVYTVLQ
jgi:dihydrofolate reductase